MGKKVTKEVTLGVLESIVEGKAKFTQWGPFSDIEICEVKGYVPNLKDKKYVDTMKQRMQDRLDYVKSLDTEMDGYNKLPKDAADAIKNVVKQANTL